MHVVPCLILIYMWFTGLDVCRVTKTQNKDKFNGEYELVGDTTTGAVLFDDPTYDAATGISNNQYLHLTDAVTSGVNTVYNKLSHDGAPTTNTQRMLPVPDQQQYSVLNGSAQ